MGESAILFVIDDLCCWCSLSIIRELLRRTSERERSVAAAAATFQLKRWKLNFSVGPLWTLIRISGPTIWTGEESKPDGR